MDKHYYFLYPPNNINNIDRNFAQLVKYEYKKSEVFLIFIS